MSSDPEDADILEITPDRVAELMPGSPVISSVPEGAKELVLQRFQLPPSRISLPTVRDNLIVIHLQGQVFVEEELRRGQRQRRWSERNQISITPAGESVTRLLKGRPDVLLVHLSNQLIQQVASEVWDADPSQLALLQCLAEPDEHVSQIGRALQTEVESLADGNVLMTELLGRAMALNLLRKHSSLGTPSTLRPLEMAKGRLNRVLDYMRENLAEPMSLHDLASLSGLGPTHFARSFRSSTGHSPYQHLIALRVEKARELLEGTSLTVLEIGLACGFNHSNHFSSIFRKYTGLSPRSWRIESRK